MLCGSILDLFLMMKITLALMFSALQKTTQRTMSPTSGWQCTRTETSRAEGLLSLLALVSFQLQKGSHLQVRTSFEKYEKYIIHVKLTASTWKYTGMHVTLSLFCTNSSQSFKTFEIVILFFNYRYKRNAVTFSIETIIDIFCIFAFYISLSFTRK